MPYKWRSPIVKVPNEPKYIAEPGYPREDYVINGTKVTVTMHAKDLHFELEAPDAPEKREEIFKSILDMLDKRGIEYQPADATAVKLELSVRSATGGTERSNDIDAQKLKDVLEDLQNGKKQTSTPPSAMQEPERPADPSKSQVRRLLAEEVKSYAREVAKFLKQEGINLDQDQLNRMGQALFDAKVKAKENAGRQ